MARIDERSLETIRRKEEELKREFESVIISLTASLSAYIEQAKASGITDIGTIRIDVETIIQNSGYNDFIDKLLSDDYAEIIDESFELYLKRTGEELNIDENILLQLENKRESENEKFTAMSSLLAAQVTDTINNSVFANISDTLTDESIINTLGSFTNRINTEITDTAFSTYTMAGIGLAIAAGLDKFLYVGPLDEKTRPFCREHVGEAKTMNEWDQLDNGQINPVSVYRGGYNCRHSLVGIG